MSKIDELIATTKLNDLINKKEEEKASKTVLWILAVIGILLLYPGLSGRL